MVKNYLKIALRNIWRERLYAFINIFGLALGMACCFLIIIFIQDELSYDRFHQNAERIHRVGFSVSLGTGEKIIASSAYPVAENLQLDFPQLERVTHFSRLFSAEIKIGDNKVRESRISFADSVFFDVFTFPLISGNPQTALLKPFSIVINETTARKYFGDEAALGKTVQMQNPYGEGDIEVTVTGVMKDMPSNSHFHMDILLSMSTGHSIFPGALKRMWGWDSQYTYVVFPQDLQLEEFNKRLIEFGKKHIEGDWFKRFFAQPITKIHLHSNLNSEIEANSDINYIYIFSIVGLIIITLAAVNYMNLATARSLRRSREVGIRKSVGAYKRQLIFQFLSESILFVIIALVLGGLAAELSLPFFNQLSGKQINSGIIANPQLLFVFAFFALVVGILSGSYPAFFLSSFKPSQVLKSSFSRIPGGSAMLRKTLVIIQFALSIGLIIGTLIVYSQFRYLQQKKLGIDANNKILIYSSKSFNNNYAAARQDLISQTKILEVASSHRRIGHDINNAAMLRVENDMGEIGDGRITTIYVDYDFLTLYDAEWIAGRNFSREFTSDSARTMIFNETAIQTLGFQNPENAVGRVVRRGGNTSQNKVMGNVVGVIKDFHFEALYNPVKPMVFLLLPDRGLNFINLKVAGGDITNTLKTIERVWRKYEPERDFRYFFLEDDLKQIYVAEKKFLQVFGLFSGIAIITACLGIFGLASFVASQRTKEIGIRKVLGANTFQISYLLTSSFIKLVLLANLLAWPLAYYAMSKWLVDFPYRVSINFWVFVLAAVMGVFIALSSIIGQTLRAAFLNPVDTLKVE